MKIVKIGENGENSENRWLQAYREAIGVTGSQSDYGMYKLASQLKNNDMDFWPPPFLHICHSF